MNRNELTNRVAGFRPDDIVPPVLNNMVLISSPVSLPDHPAERCLPELEDRNAQVIRAWLQQPDISRIAAQCTWHLAEGHPLSGVLRNRNKKSTKLILRYLSAYF
ncbi:hypothetical protein [Larkinella sp.]|uniref:hypothetical protein n=1 Tax=Larkinella sp. TaxID=2034517 RepID=UPI003BAD556B